MSISVNGQSRVPPGFRFHPTEEELLNYYLKKKLSCEKIDLDVIRDVDLNKLEPWDIQERCMIGTTPQNDWYFFSHKDKKYPTGTRTNRATTAGFWKATGRDKVIYTSFSRIGMRKTLVFYRGRAPHGQKSDWIMHEYRLDEHQDATSQSNASNCGCMGEAAGAGDEGWVVCRVFKKKSLHRTLDSPKDSFTIISDANSTSTHDGALDQILQYMGRSCKLENDPNSRQINILNYPNNNNGSSGSNHLRFLRSIETSIGSGLHERFMKLPALESPTLPSLPSDHYISQITSYPSMSDEIIGTTDPVYEIPCLSDWAEMDRLVAFHLNGQSETSKLLDDDPNFAFCTTANRLINGSSQEYNHGETSDLWTFPRSASSSSSASDHLCHASQKPI